MPWTAFPETVVLDTVPSGVLTFQPLAATTYIIIRNEDAVQIVVVSGTAFRLHLHERHLSKNRTRFDVSRNLRRARTDSKVSPNDIELSILVDFRSHSVDFRSRLDAKRRSLRGVSRRFHSTQIAKRVRDTANRPQTDRRFAIEKCREIRKNTRKTGFRASRILTYVDFARILGFSAWHCDLHRLSSAICKMTVPPITASCRNFASMATFLTGSRTFR